MSNIKNNPIDLLPEKRMQLQNLGNKEGEKEMEKFIN